MRELLRGGLKAPVIILTGLGDFEIDDRAMREGASDYLEKKNLKPSVLETCHQICHGTGPKPV